MVRPPRCKLPARPCSRSNGLAYYVCGHLLRTAIERTGCCTSLLYESSRCLRDRRGGNKGRSKYTFETFLIGSSNRFARAADEEGTILVSGRLPTEIVRSLPARPVQLVTDGTRATFTLVY